MDEAVREKKYQIGDCGDTARATPEAASKAFSCLMGCLYNGKALFLTSVAAGRQAGTFGPPLVHYVPTMTNVPKFYQCQLMASAGDWRGLNEFVMVGTCQTRTWASTTSVILVCRGPIQTLQQQLEIDPKLEWR